MISKEAFKIFTGDEVVDKIILPINISNTHWFLVVIDMKLKTISSYNSMGSQRSDVLSHIKRYLTCKAKTEGVEVTDEWRESWRCVSGSCPRQHNLYDCGMFVFVARDAFCAICR